MKNFVPFSLFDSATTLPEKNHNWNRQLKRIIIEDNIRVIVPESGSDRGPGRVGVLDSMVAVVSDEDYLTPNPNDAPIIIGSQFGINRDYLEGWKNQNVRVLVVGVSMLSGNISGVRWLD